MRAIQQNSNKDGQKVERAGDEDVRRQKRPAD